MDEYRVQNIFDLNYLKEQLKKLPKELDTAIKEDTILIKNMTESDKENLLIELYQDCLEVLNLNSKISYINSQLSQMYDKKNKLNYHKNLTKNKIFKKTKKELGGIIFIHNISFLVAMVASTNIDDFMRKIAMILTISLVSYNINLTYFTSEYYKEKTINELNALEKEIEINELILYLQKLYRDFFSKEIELETKRLLEISSEINENITVDDIYKKIHTALPKEKIKKRVR